jgi:hypothetical protein
VLLLREKHWKHLILTEASDGLPWDGVVNCVMMGQQQIKGMKNPLE